jgi:hypothetical protein
MSADQRSENQVSAKASRMVRSGGKKKLVLSREVTNQT